MENTKEFLVQFSGKLVFTPNDTSLIGNEFEFIKDMKVEDNDLNLKSYYIEAVKRLKQYADKQGVLGVFNNNGVIKVKVFSGKGFVEIPNAPIVITVDNEDNFKMSAYKFIENTLNNVETVIG